MAVASSLTLDGSLSCLIVLRYRGYPIEQIAEHSNFLEVAYLLIYGSLPTGPNFEVFEREVMRHTIVHVDAEGLFKSFRCLDCLQVVSSLLCQRD